MKRCSKCGETKPFAEFHKLKRSKDGHKSQCKVCKAEAHKRYREENREAIKERRRQYYQENKDYYVRWRKENKEAIREYSIEYRQKNKEALRERGQQYYHENKEACRERNRQYYQDNREEAAEYKRRYNQENKEAIAERSRRYREENKEAIAERARQYRKIINSKQIALIYQIVNSINGKVYVGQTMRGVLRWNQHLCRLRGNRHVNPNLQADFNEFGADVFEWSIIQELPKDKEVLEREEINTIQRLLAEGKELYNIVLN